jgi:hypothetical protein
VIVSKALSASAAVEAIGFLDHSWSCQYLRAAKAGRVSSLRAYKIHRRALYISQRPLAAALLVLNKHFVGQVHVVQ